MNQWWNDEQFIAELDKRSADLKSGKDKGISWNELKKELLGSITTAPIAKYNR